VTSRLKAEIVEQEEASVTGQRGGKHVSAATNQRATIEELLEAVFSVRSSSFFILGIGFSISFLLFLLEQVSAIIIK
jgi:hypothetical protein